MMRPREMISESHRIEYPDLFDALIVSNYLLILDKRSYQMFADC
jgi:hypothetical protein